MLYDLNGQQQSWEKKLEHNDKCWHVRYETDPEQRDCKFNAPAITHFDGSSMSIEVWVDNNSRDNTKQDNEVLVRSYYVILLRMKRSHFYYSQFKFDGLSGKKIVCCGEANKITALVTYTSIYNTPGGWNITSYDNNRRLNMGNKYAVFV